MLVGLIEIRPAIPDATNLVLHRGRTNEDRRARARVLLPFFVFCAYASVL